MFAVVEKTLQVYKLEDVIDFSVKYKVSGSSKLDFPKTPGDSFYLHTETMAVADILFLLKDEKGVESEVLFESVSTMLPARATLLVDSELFPSDEKKASKLLLRMRKFTEHLTLELETASILRKMEEDADEEQMDEARSAHVITDDLLAAQANRIEVLNDTFHNKFFESDEDTIDELVSAANMKDAEADNFRKSVLNALTRAVGIVNDLMSAHPPAAQVCCSCQEQAGGSEGSVKPSTLRLQTTKRHSIECLFSFVESL